MMSIENLADNPGAVIVDGHGHTDLGVVRSLGRCNVPVYLATNDRNAPVCYSRYVERIFDFPADSASELEKIKALREIGRSFRHKPVLFSTGDGSLVLLSRYRTALEHFFRHHLAPAPLVEQLLDKRLFARLAGQNRLPVPYTVVPKDRRDLEASLWGLRFPVVVKPAQKQSWSKHAALWVLTGGNLKAVRIDSARELLRFYDAITPYNSDVVIQEYIEGRDEALYSLYAYIDRNRNVKAWALSQKIRTHPPHRGVGTYSVTRNNRVIFRLGLSALRALGVTGMAILQVKWSEVHKRWLILEINARHGTSISLYPKAGVNLPYVAYRDSLGCDVTAQPEQEEGVRWVDMASDWAAFQRYRALGEWGWPSFLHSHLARRKTYAKFSWSDPLPALVPLWRRVQRKSATISNRVGGYAKR